MILLSILLALHLMSLSGADPMQNLPVPEEAARSIVMRYGSDGKPNTVSVAGSFNDWNRLKNPMILQPDGRTWSVTISLPPGIYQYLFVIDGARWINDPHAGKDENNGNSVLVVTPPDYDSRPGVVADGIITPSAVRHRPSAPDVMRVDKDHFTFRLRTRAHDVARCWLRAWLLNKDALHVINQSDLKTPQTIYVRKMLPDLEGHTREQLSVQSDFPMHRYASDALYDYWRVRVPITENGYYVFRLQDGQTVRYYGATHRLEGSEPDQRFEVRPSAFPLLKVPDWVRDAVFYEIFPDRFADGDPSNDPPGTQPWGSPPTHTNRMGGDLAGVMQHIDYLQQLGVNALYFTPIFSAISNHEYDTTDYHTVDPRFGSNQTLKKLVAGAHARGWHVILDGVFNHTGLDFFAFQSLLKEGERSPYRDWYFVKKFPIEARDGQNTYVGWNSVYTLPKLNVSNPATRDYLLDVGVRWIKETGIDGWRLDSADVVSQDFWRAFHKAVRAADPNAYILGEVWDDASAWLQGDQFDAVMNYRWRGAVLDFFVNDKISAGPFAARLDRIAEDYPAAAQGVLFNLLGSHDTERIRTLCKGNWPKERQAILFQMTYPGVPCIYYGDEVGLEGGRDPDCRRCMPWDTAAWDQETLQFTRQAIALRNQHAVFRRGDYRTVLVDDKKGLFGFLRTTQQERALALFNRSDQAQTITLPLQKIGAARFTDGLTGALVPAHNGRLTVTLLPRGATVLLASPLPARQEAKAAPAPKEFLVGGDISMLSKIEEQGGVFKKDNQPGDAIAILQSYGCNCFRLRLFVNPNHQDGTINDLDYTLALAKRIKAAGARFLLDFHYSDTWADPGKQYKPAAWADLDFPALEKKVTDYTAQSIAAFKAQGALPDIVQVGNEITPGMLWPDGRLGGEGAKPTDAQWDHFVRLLKAAIRGVKKPLSKEDHVRIMIHIDRGADWPTTKWFFDNLRKRRVAFDIIGQSYYPWWHGTLDQVRDNLRQTAQAFGKYIVIVETAYPFRGDWSRWKNKNMGWPISLDGQKQFLTDLVAAVKATPDGHGLGVLWWFPESIPIPGRYTWNEGSTALFDDKGNAVPALQAFRSEK